jgi:hypothetical protein
MRCSARAGANVGRLRLRRRRRAVWRRGHSSRWLWVGSYALLLFGSATYKLRRDEVWRIEVATGARVWSLSEDELVAAMKRLGMGRRGLSDADQVAIAGAF